MMKARYLSTARWNPLRYYDGDTFDVSFDPGFGIRLVETRQVRYRVRLIEFDAPALWEAGGTEAKNFLQDWMQRAHDEYFYGLYDFPLQIETFEVDNFGRWLSDVTRLIDGRNLAEDMKAAGHDTERRWS